jgi:hypothetical protein
MTRLRRRPPVRVPGQPLAAVQERGLVGLDGEQVVRLLDGDQEVCSLGVGLERVGGDHRAGQVQALKQRLEAGHLAGGAVDLALGQHPAGGVLHGGQQVDPAGRRDARRAASCRPPRPPVAAGQDGHGVTAATRGAWVGDGGQVGQQVTGLGHLQRDGIGKLGEGRWDRG